MKIKRVRSGQDYYFVQVNGQVERAQYRGTELQEEMVKIGNHFLNHRDAEAAASAFRLILPGMHK